MDNALCVYQAAAARRGKLQSAAVERWACARGLVPLKYDWGADVWYFSDGEAYTTSAIIIDEAADNLLRGEGREV